MEVLGESGLASHLQHIILWNLVAIDAKARSRDPVPSGHPQPTMNEK